MIGIVIASMMLPFLAVLYGLADSPKLSSLFTGLSCLVAYVLFGTGG